MRLALIIFAMVLVLCGAMLFTVSYVNALTLADPWTQQVATFNPKGVKFSGGITTGNELMVGYAHSWTVEQGRTTAELLVNKIEQ